MFLVVAIAQQRSDGTITPTTSGSGIEGGNDHRYGSMPNELFRVHRATPIRRLPAPYFMTNSQNSLWTLREDCRGARYDNQSL